MQLFISLALLLTIPCNAIIHIKQSSVPWRKAHVHKDSFTYELDIESPSKLICSAAASQIQWPISYKYASGRCYLSIIAAMPTTESSVPADHIIIYTKLDPTEGGKKLHILVCDVR